MAMSELFWLLLLNSNSSLSIVFIYQIFYSITSHLNLFDFGPDKYCMQYDLLFKEPVLFSGTMRKNLDPFNQYSDDVLLNALNNVELQSDDGVG